MRYKELRRSVKDVNCFLPIEGLVKLTWGNASAIDRKEGVMAIKPSGVDFDLLRSRDIVVLNLRGDKVSGNLKPSVDAPTHLHLYKIFGDIGGIVHSHSTYATAFAQAGSPILCLGTTHADHFYGDIPIVRELRKDEMKKSYEIAVGKSIVDTFKTLGLNYREVPACLLPHHGVFAWGRTIEDALTNAIAVEEVAKMNILTLGLNPKIQSLPNALLKEHYRRKHGKDAYYGQK